MFALLLMLLFPFSAAADAPHFTTVFFDDEGVVYVGVKNSMNDAVIISLPFSSGERTLIPLPVDSSHREVIGLLTEKTKLFVLSSGEGTLFLHIYDRGKNSWTKLGKVACPSFTKARLSAARITFSCEVGKTKRGKTRVSRKSISYGKERMYRSGIIRFPEFLLRHKGRVAVLEGNAPHWDRLRLRTDDDERMISANDLLQIPMPPKP
jgi:hypothetical protein